MEYPSLPIHFSSLAVVLVTSKQAWPHETNPKCQNPTKIYANIINVANRYCVRMDAKI